MEISLRAKRTKLISDSAKLTKCTIWMPSLTLKMLPYYDGKPSGLFNEYSKSGFNIYHNIPKRHNVIQENRLVEIMLSFRINPNSLRSKILSFCKYIIYHKYNDILKQ